MGKCTKIISSHHSVVMSPNLAFLLTPYQILWNFDLHNTQLKKMTRWLDAIAKRLLI